MTRKPRKQTATHSLPQTSVQAHAPLRYIPTGVQRERLLRMMEAARGDRSQSSQEASPPRQHKAARLDDGMEQELAQPTMQATDAATADQQQPQQTSQQDNQLALLPSSPEGGDAVQLTTQPDSADTDDRLAAILAALAQVQDMKQHHQQRLAECQGLERELQAALSTFPEGSTQPTQQAQPQPSQKAQPTQQSRPQPSKQPIAQPSTQAPKQPRYAEVLAATCSAVASAVVTSLLPRSGQQQARQGQTQRSKQPQPSFQSARQSNLVGVDRFSHLLHFTLSGGRLDLSGSPRDVVNRVVAEVAGDAEVQVVDVVRLGSVERPRFQFKVASLEQADTLVRGRGRALAGTGVVLSEVLTASEVARHKQLWPTFLRLQRAGHKVQFKRARLFVDGQLWTAPLV